MATLTDQGTLPATPAPPLGLPDLQGTLPASGGSAKKPVVKIWNPSTSTWDPAPTSSP